MKKQGLTFLLILVAVILSAQTPVWTKHEIQLQSSKTYNNPIYDVRDFKVTFSAPSGRTRTVYGFW